MNETKVVSLEQLVAQPKLLKLLILHTPFPLKIDTLPLYTNLIKLDLSKNNLQSFPYLGHLTQLKFMFLHENSLDLQDLTGIFIQKGQKSYLSENIVWVTYWGNKNGFLARHFLANETAALAVDTYLIVPQQKKSAILLNSSKPFSPQTDISQILQEQKKLDANMPQQQYMKNFWDQIHQVRRKYQAIFSIIKIQKLFRGWIYRKKKADSQRKKQEDICAKKQVFQAWKQHVWRCLKLRYVLQKHQQQHLLLPYSEMRTKQIQLQMIKKAKEARQRVLIKKKLMKPQQKFKNILKNFYTRIMLFYKLLEVETSKSIFIMSNGWNEFSKHIIPFACKFNPSAHYETITNHNANLRFFYEIKIPSNIFLQIISYHHKSNIILQKQQNKDYKYRNKSIFRNCSKGIPAIYNKIHLSKKSVKRITQMNQFFQSLSQYNKKQLIQIKANQRFLKDLVRGIYFYNSGMLTKPKPSTSIAFFTQGIIIRKTSATLIQKIWRGFSCRKKSQHLKQKCKRLRAIIKIQRWIRKLPNIKKKQFMFYNSWIIRNIEQEYFYIKNQQYFELMLNHQDLSKTRMKFLEQQIAGYLDMNTNEIVLYWDSQSKKKQINLNYSLKKGLFYYQFMKHMLMDGVPNYDSHSHMKFNEQNMLKLSLQHLFHYYTSTSTFKYRGQQYIKISCKSKMQCRKRILAISLMTYNFKQKQPLVLTQSQINIKQIQRQRQRQIKNEEAVFVYTSKFIQQSLTAYQSKCTVKCYLATGKDSKPIKLVEQLRINVAEKLMIQNSNPSSNMPSSIQLVQKPKFNIDNFLFTEPDVDFVRIQTQPSKQNDSFSKIINSNQRRTLKGIKVIKKIKHNFMLDNAAKKITMQRFQTEPDFPEKINSMSLNNLQQTNSAKSINKIKQIQHRSMIKKQQKQEQKKLDSFTKNFINMGNFIQSHLNEGYRKRIRTEIEIMRFQSAEKVKSLQKQSKDKQRKVRLQRIQNARKMHKIHEDSLADAQALNNKLIEQKLARKNMLNKKVGRRPKISFAQQCYPIKSKKQNKSMN